MRSVRAVVVAAVAACALALGACAVGGEDRAGAPSATPGQRSPGDASQPPPGPDRASPDGAKPGRDGAGRDGDGRDEDGRGGDGGGGDSRGGAFARPPADDLWQPDRMARARQPPHATAGGARGGTDRIPEPVPARQVPRPYHRNMAPVGKVFFDRPEGPTVCSGTVVRDPAHPGASNLVWTAGHCVHGGARGTWMRNIVFVPAYNDRSHPAERLADAPPAEVSPYGVWWADWSQTSDGWLRYGGTGDERGSAYDFAVLHVRPKRGGASLEETVGAAIPIWFGAPPAGRISGVSAYGYPAAPPYDGARMFRCVGPPGRLAAADGAPALYRVGCTMTGGASGGGWFVSRDGVTMLVSNSAIGSTAHTWLAGPHLGSAAREVFDAVSQRFAER
ncbi:trypsin-like serine peptidase [Streptomyces buecherae]|uniref:trypsin-like serine peptidase n=1 Tax=Streptomyces buecherae TaxID=2763006 RepID=UPI0037A4B15C